MGNQPENYHKLKHHPEIKEWFEEAINILDGLIEPTITTLKHKKKLSSNLVAKLEPQSYPWPLVTCRSHVAWEQNTATPLGDADFALITQLSHAISNLKINDG